MAKPIYYSLKQILSRDATYNLIYGERSNGKSYAVKKYCLERFRDYGEQFVIIRRRKSDITKVLSDLYFSDAPIADIFRDKNIIYTQSGRVYVAYRDDDGKTTGQICVGYVRALSEAQRYSSGAYNDVQNIVLEEYISLDGAYLPNEIMLFRHIISTIARKRAVKIFMIANTISRLSPYWREFGVKNIERQAIGTIDEYEMETEDGNIIKIACEYCANSATRSKIFFGADSKMTNEGKWLTNEYPHITMDMLDNSVDLMAFVVEYNTTRFYCRVMMRQDNNGVFLYVTPKTTAPKDYTTVYTNVVTTNPYYRRGLMPRTQREKNVLSLIDSRCYFSDNLTGTEFSETVKKLRAL